MQPVREIVFTAASNNAAKLLHKQNIATAAEGYSKIKFNLSCLYKKDESAGSDFWTIVTCKIFSV